MGMIRVTANAREATYNSNDLITSGSVGIPVTFNLSSEFDSLSNIAVFRGSGVSIDVALTSAGECVVPSEAVAQSGGYLQIGVYGRNAEGTIVIPTVWAGSKMILPGVVPSGVDPAEPTPDWTAQVQQMATEALEKAQNVEDMSVEAETLAPGSPLNVEKTIDPETGAVTLMFYLTPGQDGVSPIIAVEEITGGHRVTVTDAQGTRSFDVLDGTNGDDGRGIASAVMNADYTLTLTYTDGTSYTTPSLRGAPGADGYSPFAYVRKSGKVVTISITDKKGTTTATVSDGEDGAPGVSPTITVTDITGGHRVTITDAEGAHSFDVMDGDSADAPVQDVQVNGVSVLQDGVANVPLASNDGDPGVVKLTTGANGIVMDNNGFIYLASPTEAQLKQGNNAYRALKPGTQHISTFYGLAKAAGDTTQSASSNAVGNYTEEAKIAIQKMLGVYREWELIADVTVSEDSQIFDVDTDISGQPFTLSNMFVRAYLEPSTTSANDYIAAANLTVTTDDVSTNTSGTTQRYLANGAATYFEYTSEIISGVTLTRGRTASQPNSSQSILAISSPTSNTKAFRGFRLSRYNSSSSLIPAGSHIMLYGIRT